MDTLGNLISKIELLIRYLLSGVALYAIYLLGLRDPSPQIDWICKQHVLAAFIAGSAGFTAYLLYRIMFWFIGDMVAWYLRLSAPSLDHRNSTPYHSAYTRFLIWRQNKSFDEALSGYLNYRWAVVHFTYIVVFALWFALAHREADSFIATWQSHVIVASLALFLLAIWQSLLLFQVEKDIYAGPPDV